MKIHVYSIMWNEEYMLPYFLRHYSTCADKIVIINDHSTDKTVQIAQKNNKVTVIPFEYSRGLHEEDFNECFAVLYKKYSQGVADWVMCVDADEFIYHPDIRNHLTRQRQKGVQIIKTTGFTMIGKKRPHTRGQIYDACRYGVRSRQYDKPVIFDPNLDILFGDGRHSMRLSNHVRPVKAKMLLLHFRYLSKAYFLKRTCAAFARSPSLFPYKDYRIKRGLQFYKQAIQSGLQKVI